MLFCMLFSGFEWSSLHLKSYSPLWLNFYEEIGKMEKKWLTFGASASIRPNLRLQGLVPEDLGLHLPLDCFSLRVQVHSLGSSVFSLFLRRGERPALKRNQGMWTFALCFGKHYLRDLSLCIFPFVLDASSIVFGLLNIVTFMSQKIIFGSYLGQRCVKGRLDCSSV